jgi:hypothetical protein
MYHVTVWLGDMADISVCCDTVAISEALAIAAGRRSLIEQFPEVADAIRWGPSVATPMRSASDGEILSSRIPPFKAKE